MAGTTEMNSGYPGAGFHFGLGVPAFVCSQILWFRTGGMENGKLEMDQFEYKVLYVWSVVLFFGLPIRALVGSSFDSGQGPLLSASPLLGKD